MEILPIHNQITGLVLSWCPKILCLCPVPQVQGILCRTHRPPIYLHHRPPSHHPAGCSVSVGTESKFLISCPLSKPRFPWSSAHRLKWGGWRRAGCFQSCSALCSASVGWFCWSVGTSCRGRKQKYILIIHRTCFHQAALRYF